MSKDDKPSKSIFEEFNIQKPTIKMNPFTGKNKDPKPLYTVSLRYMYMFHSILFDS